MRRIYLRNIHKYALLDDDDYARLSHFAWYGYRNNSDDHHYYVRATVNYGSGRVKTLQMHRIVIWPQPGQVVTFKNRNRLDCRKDNLVIASRSVIRQHGNGWAEKHTSIYRGVHKHDCGKFVPCLKVNGVTLHLGLFDDELEAAKVYDRAALMYFPPELVSTNFPIGTYEDLN